MLSILLETPAEDDNLPVDGNYQGSQTAYAVTFRAPSRNEFLVPRTYVLQTQIGVRGFNVNVVVTVANGVTTVIR